MDDNIFKVISAAIVSFFGYCLFLAKRTTNRFDRHEVKINDHDKHIAVIDNQLQHILEKLTDMVELSTDLKKANNTILRTLTRKARENKKV